MTFTVLIYNNVFDDYEFIEGVKKIKIDNETNMIKIKNKYGYRFIDTDPKKAITIYLK